MGKKKFPLVLIKIQQNSNTPLALLFFPLPLSFSPLSSVCSNSHRLALLPLRMPPWTVHDHSDENIKLAAFVIEMEQWRTQERWREEKQYQHLESRAVGEVEE